jgi:hypothetical protein
LLDSINKPSIGKDMNMASNNRLMRNATLNLTSSSNSGQTSKRLVIKNLKGFYFILPLNYLDSMQYETISSSFS